MKTTVICVLLALSFLALPTDVQAQDYLWVTNDSGTITITGYTGAGGAVVIPGTISGLPVTSIGDMACANNLDISSVIIPDSVTHIGFDAFWYCENMTNAALGTGVMTIGESAFGFCSNLAALALPDSLTDIGSFAFGGCSSLTNITIPHTVISIGYGAFLYCTDLRAITVDPLNSFYSSLDGVLFNHDQATLLAYPPGKGDSYSIPANTLTVGDSAFYSCRNLTRVSIPNTVSSIERSAFRSCSSLTNVTGAANVTNVGSYAFANCASFTTVVIPATVTSIGGGPFSGCTGLTAILVEAENSCYTSVDGVLFNHERTLLVQYPAGKAGSYAIPAGVTTIGEAAFASCYNLTSIIIPNGVTRISSWSFDFCGGLTTVTIPDTATHIDFCAFRFCRNLTSVTIGKNVIDIGGSAFAGCSLLQTVYFTGNAPSVGTYVFDGDDQAIVYYLPGTTGWGTTFGGRPTAPYSLPNQLILTCSPSFGGQTNEFGFIISWVTNLTVVVEACTNLANPLWSPVGTNIITGGSSYFSDPEWTNYPGRFYRLRSP